MSGKPHKHWSYEGDVRHPRVHLGFIPWVSMIEALAIYNGKYLSYVGET